MAAVALLATSCGGSKSGENAASESESQFTPATVTVKDNSSTTFSGDFSDYVELVPGEYTLDIEEGWGTNGKIILKATVIGQSDGKISSNSFVNVYDANDNQIARMSLYGWDSSIDSAINNGELGGEYEMTFMYYPDNNEELTKVLENAKTIKAGDAIQSQSSSSSSSSDSSSSSASSEYTVRPASTEVGGVLSGIVTIEDKEYPIVAGSGLGQDFYTINPTFVVSGSKKFEKEIEIEAELFDENGKKISFDCESMGRSYKTDVFRSFSNGFLQMAIADGDDCTRTSIMIRSEFIKNFTPEMLEKVKTFKVTTRFNEYEDFDYSNDLYK